MQVKRGFIGPIGDDLPSIVGIVLALGLFFAGISYSFNVYNQKSDNLTKMKGAIEITRTITKEGLITTDIDTLNQMAVHVADSYGLEYNAELDPVLQTVDCPGHAFTYLVAARGVGTGDVGLATLYICIWEK